jgi:uncharacterized cupredoxin-like copper-binding protein
MKSVPTLAAAIALSGAAALFAVPTVAHEGHHHFSAGEPGNPKMPARTVAITMEEQGTHLFFAPARVVVRKGEQIRFKLFNDGSENHEFVLATVRDNLHHAAYMKTHPHMAHHDPNAITLTPYTDGELLWKFTKRGTFEYGCLIPGHREAGMHGTVVVK